MEQENNNSKFTPSKDFFKQFKNEEEFKSFFNDLYKQGVEAMLQAELDEHLGMRNMPGRGIIQAIIVMVLIPRKLRPSQLEIWFFRFQGTGMENIPLA